MLLSNILIQYKLDIVFQTYKKCNYFTLKFQEIDNLFEREHLSILDLIFRGKKTFLAENRCYVYHMNIYIYAVIVFNYEFRFIDVL